MDLRRSEGANDPDVHVQEVARVGGLIELALVREALGVGSYAVVAVPAVGVDSSDEGGGRVEGGPNELLDAVEADVEAAAGCRTAAALSGARASLWEVARELCVPVLSLDGHAAAGGGGQPWPSRSCSPSAPRGSRERQRRLARRVGRWGGSPGPLGLSRLSPRAAAGSGSAAC